MFMSSCNWISNNKNITYYLSTWTPTSTENCLYQLREFVLCNKWSVYAYICSPPLYRSLFSKFVSFFIFWMNNLTHVKFDIHSLWSLIKNVLFFLVEFNVLPLLQNSPWFCQGSTTCPNYIFHSSHNKKTLISFFSYSFCVFAFPLKFILFIFLLNPFKIDSTIAFILYCLRSYSVCFFKGYCRI